jgi:hypothetical protein
MAGSFERGSEPSVLVKCEEFKDLLAFREGL